MSDLSFHTLSAKVHGAKSAADLAFVFCNDTHALVDYRQAALVGFFGARRTQLAGHSGLSDIDSNSPYALWLADVANHVRKQLDALPAAARVLALSAAMLPPAMAAQWAEWMPDHVWVLSLAGPDGKSRAALFLGREAPWPTDFDTNAPEFLLLQATQTFGYAWWSLTERRKSLHTLGASLWARKSFRFALAAIPLLLFVPVREYALVPAEVVSNHSQVISSPREGVIKRMVVKPNTPVQAGQVLAEMDDSTLFNKLAVAQAAYASARTDLLQASQRAIEKQDAKADINLAEGKQREREVDVASIQREIDLLSIKAPAAGVFVYSDPNDWAGRPVQTGERVGLLADPKVLGLQAWAPVNEAVNLKPGAPMTMFMRVAPLAPVAAKLDYAGYQVIEAPNGVASYLLRGTLDNPDEKSEARIGLRGTARISGDWTMLGYLMFRRPLAAAREWCGC